MHIISLLPIAVELSPSKIPTTAQAHEFFVVDVWCDTQVRIFFTLALGAAGWLRPIRLFKECSCVRIVLSARRALSRAARDAESKRDLCRRPIKVCLCPCIEYVAQDTFAKLALVGLFLPLAIRFSKPLVHKDGSVVFVQLCTRRRHLPLK